MPSDWSSKTSDYDEDAHYVDDASDDDDDDDEDDDGDNDGDDDADDDGDGADILEGVLAAQPRGWRWRW